MFLSAILGLEKSFSRSLLYVMLTTSAYMLFGAFVYAFIVGLPVASVKIGEIVNK